MAGMGERGRLDPVVTHTQVFPKSLQFPSPKAPQFDLWRDKYRIDSVAPTYSPTAGLSKIQIKIPNTHVFDFRQAHLAFTVTTSGPGGGVTQWLSFNAWSIFKVFRIQTPQVLEEQRNYNLYSNFLSETSQDIGATLAFAPAWGAQGLATRQANGTVATNYQVPIFSQFLMGSIIPAKFFTEELLLEIELAPPAECMESSAALTSQSYTLSNIILWTDVIYSNFYENFLAGAIAAGGLNFSFQGFDFQQSNPLTGAQYNISITQRSDAVSGYVFLMADSGYRTNIQNLDKFLTWNKGNLTLAQLRYNGRYYPTQPLDLTGNAFLAYLELLKLIRGKYSAYGIIKEAPLLTLTTFNSSRFALFFDVNHLLDDGLISRKKTSGQNQDTTLQLTLSGAMGNNQVIDILILVYRSVFLTSSGTFQVAQ